MLENLEAPASQIKEGVPESFRGSQEVLDDFSSSAGEEGFCEDDEEHRGSFRHTTAPSGQGLLGQDPVKGQAAQVVAGRD